MRGLARFPRNGSLERCIRLRHVRYSVTIVSTEGERRTIVPIYATSVGEAIGRTTPYTKQHANNLMRETDILEQAKWPVRSIPVVEHETMETIVGDLLQKPRRNSQSRILAKFKL